MSPGMDNTYGPSGPTQRDPTHLSGSSNLNSIYTPTRKGDEAILSFIIVNSCTHLSARWSIQAAKL